MVELWTAHAEKQFKELTEQTKELSALGQKIAGEGAEPITRGVNRALDGSVCRTDAKDHQRGLALQNE